MPAAPAQARAEACDAAPPGRLIAVVGPSGVGKDTVMQALHALRPALHLVRRTITRAVDAGGEAFNAVDEAEFRRRRERGDFALWWQAHGHHYGIPASLRPVLAERRDALVNLSRGVIAEARQLFPTLHVLSLTAAPEVLAARLSGRGRETPDAIAQRLLRRAEPMAEDLTVTTLANDGPLDATVAAALAALYPASGERAIR